MDFNTFDTAFSTFIHSKTFRWILVGVGAVLVALLIFQGGVFVGYRKANFSYRWGENYHQNFGGPRGGFLRDMGMFGGDFANPHGTFGRIIKLELPRVTVQGQDAEKVILVKDSTVIQRFRDTVQAKDLKVGDNVVVIGSPNNAGQVEAEFIRIVPSSPSPFEPGTSTPMGPQ